MGGLALIRYEVQWRESGQAFSSSRQASVTTESYTRTGLTNGTEYTFRVRAVNSAGSGTFSNEVSATPEGLVPDSITDVGFVRGASTIDVSYASPAANGSAILGYRIEWRREGEAYNATNRADVTALTYQITGLDSGPAYDVRIRARNANGNAPWLETTIEAGGMGMEVLLWEGSEVSTASGISIVLTDDIDDYDSLITVSGFTGNRDNTEKSVPVPTSLIGTSSATSAEFPNLSNTGSRPEPDAVSQRS